MYLMCSMFSMINEWNFYLEDIFMKMVEESMYIKSKPIQRHRNIASQYNIGSLVVIEFKGPLSPHLPRASHFLKSWFAQKSRKKTLPWEKRDSLIVQLVGEDSACNAGDPGSIPGSGRSPGEGIGYPCQYSWASLVAQLVNNGPAMWGALGFGRSPGKGKGYPLQYSGLENSTDCIVHGVTKSWTCDWVTFTFTFLGEEEMARWMCCRESMTQMTPSVACGCFHFTHSLLLLITFPGLVVRRGRGQLCTQTRSGYPNSFTYSRASGWLIAVFSLLFATGEWVNYLNSSSGQILTLDLQWQKRKHLNQKTKLKGTISDFANNE